MKVYIIIGSNDDESDYRIGRCFLSEESAYDACSRLNSDLSNGGFSYFVICREIVDYDRQK